MMGNNINIAYDAPGTEQFYKDCLEHCVSTRIDMMPDNSWRRYLSDKTLQWVFENFDQSREFIFIQKYHIMDSEKEKWRNKNAHIEAGFTIRINSTDYMVLMEIDVEYLPHFIEKYQLMSR